MSANKRSIASLLNKVRHSRLELAQKADRETVAGGSTAGGSSSSPVNGDQSGKVDAASSGKVDVKSMLSKVKQAEEKQVVKEVYVVTRKPEESLGLYLSSGGCVVNQVLAGSPAERACLPSDVKIVEVNGVAVANSKEFGKQVTAVTGRGEDLRFTAVSAVSGGPPPEPQAERMRKMQAIAAAAAAAAAHMHPQQQPLSLPGMLDFPGMPPPLPPGPMPPGFQMPPPLASPVPPNLPGLPLDLSGDMLPLPLPPDATPQQLPAPPGLSSVTQADGSALPSSASPAVNVPVSGGNADPGSRHSPIDSTPPLGTPPLQAPMPPSLGLPPAMMPPPEANSEIVQQLTALEKLVADVADKPRAERDAFLASLAQQNFRELAFLSPTHEMHGFFQMQLAQATAKEDLGILDEISAEILGEKRSPNEQPDKPAAIPLTAEKDAAGSDHAASLGGFMAPMKLQNRLSGATAAVQDAQARSLSGGPATLNIPSLDWKTKEKLERAAEKAATTRDDDAAGTAAAAAGDELGDKRQAVDAAAAALVNSFASSRPAPSSASMQQLPSSIHPSLPLGPPPGQGGPGQLNETQIRSLQRNVSRPTVMHSMLT
eukprot:gene16530-25356_t